MPRKGQTFKKRIRDCFLERFCCLSKGRVYRTNALSRRKLVLKKELCVGERALRLERALLSGQDLVFWACSLFSGKNDVVIFRKGVIF